MRSVRWDNLRVETEENRTLPGYREPAAIRTFDAPEAMNVRFYEVQAKSILNRVPKASRVPFRWTINPYRGCTHSCLYCMWGTTPILMGDGRTKPIADVREGDYVYGTVRKGHYRRYWVTQVFHHWSTIKPAFRITLEDGTELIASGDHRFLTGRGWKHVINTPCGSVDRSHLTLNDRLMGTGAFAEQPDHWPDYRRGDGHLRLHESAHRFRLALTDMDALRRARSFLEAEIGVALPEFAFGTHGRRSMRQIRTGVWDNVAAITELIAWPRGPRTEWCKGFLAGIFDAEGSHSGSLRIVNCDPAIIDWITWSLRLLGFRFGIEDPRRPNGLKCVRLLGGVPEKLRFFLTVDPAIDRKRELDSIALKNPSAKLKVESIEPLGKGWRLYDITTGTGDFIANGVVSHNCFARPTHTYLDFNAREDFEREIVVKVNTPEVARAELMRPRWTREHVALGTNTDPYQWVEKKYELLPGVWEAMRDSRTPCSVLTKSPLLLRDIELFKQIPSFAANLSIPTLDEKAWRASEPHTPHPRKRIEAVAELNRAGIPTGVLIAPLMPGINDSPEQVEKILELCAEAGAVSIGGICLHLRGEVRDIVMDWLRSYRPDLVPRYERLYARGAYAPKAERERIARLVREGRRVTNLRRDPATSNGSVDESEDTEPQMAAPPPEQDSLF
jgi:DNA repair photolyase